MLLQTEKHEIRRIYNVPDFSFVKLAACRKGVTTPLGMIVVWELMNSVVLFSSLLPFAEKQP